jgi:L-threonylcarbamoyladenylate synthase
MDHLLVDPVTPDPATLARAARVILAGGVVAYPTDTLYGLAVDPRSDRAVDRLFAVKARAGDQPIPLIAAGVEQVEREIAHLTELGRRLAARFWPGPVTLVLEARPAISSRLQAGTGTIAVRVPDHTVARLLAAQCGGAITSTSANLSGEPPPDAGSRLAPSIRDRIDALLDAGPTPGGRPSTIVDVTGTAPLLVREGVVAWARVLECV